MNSKTNRILVSGCLGGAKIRHDASGVDMNHPIWQRWEREGRFFYFCPEIAAGFEAPRPAAEIVKGTAAEVIDDNAEVREDTGANVTEMFIKGAQLAVEAATREGVVMAVLTDGSPSCGSTYVYGGKFDGEIRPGRGVVVELLIRAGLRVFPHTDLKIADAYLMSLAHRSAPAKKTRDRDP